MSSTKPNTKQLFEKAFATIPNNISFRDFTTEDFKEVGSLNTKFRSAQFHTSHVVILLKLYDPYIILDNYEALTQESKDDLNEIIRNPVLRESLGLPIFNVQNEAIATVMLDKENITGEIIMNELNTTFWHSSFEERLSFLVKNLPKLKIEDRNMVLQKAQISISDLNDNYASQRDKMRFLAMLVKTWQSTADVASTLFRFYNLKNLDDGLFFSIWNTAGKKFSGNNELVEHDDGTTVSQEIVWNTHPHGKSVYKFLNACSVTSLYDRDYSAWPVPIRVRFLNSVVNMIDVDELATLADKILDTNFISVSLTLFNTSADGEVNEDGLLVNADVVRRQNVLEVVQNFAQNMEAPPSLDQEYELFFENSSMTAPEPEKEVTLDDLIY